MFTEKLIELLATITKIQELVRQCGSSAAAEALDKVSCQLLRDFLDKNQNVFGFALTASEQELARDYSQKIACIKAVRARTLLGLKEAKDLVENWQKANNIQPRSF